MTAPRPAPLTLPERAGVLVAVDPGIRSPGVSVWLRVLPGGTWRHVASRAPLAPGARSPAQAARGIVDAVVAAVGACPPSRVALVVEWPAKRATHTASHAAVEALREVVAALPWRPVAGGKVAPEAWKGNVPKEITRHRLRPVLAEVGGHVDPPDSPDAFDAFGLGAWALGLRGRGCV